MALADFARFAVQALALIRLRDGKVDPHHGWLSRLRQFELENHPTLRSNRPMRKWNIVAAALAGALLIQSVCILHAQDDPYHHIQQSVFADVRATIVRAIGAQDQTVEITVTDKVLIVLRVNSNMNGSTHAGRDNEAAAIASIVSKAIAGKPEFDNLVALRVDYVTRSATGDSAVIDSVEFREDPKGAFRFHPT